MAINKIGKREAMRAALNNAAALIEAADLYSLFGDDLYCRALDYEGGEDVLTEAQAKVVERIRRMISGD
ncbi:hypothetical protein [Pigmentiphaga daeguensis]|uniref:Uncharacterized protein n=1 Tax=Pigmentiphaga daeguensis TaxID=414049 RepID=A0ABP3L790_9BURK